jgi:hypothetical protein
MNVLNTPNKLEDCNCYCTCGICFRREYEEYSDDFYVFIEKEDSRFGPLCNWIAYNIETSDVDTEELASGYEFTMKDALEAGKIAAERALKVKANRS